MYIVFQNVVLIIFSFILTLQILMLQQNNIFVQNMIYFKILEVVGLGKKVQLHLKYRKKWKKLLNK